MMNEKEFSDAYKNEILTMIGFYHLVQANVTACVCAIANSSEKERQLIELIEL